MLLILLIFSKKKCPVWNFTSASRSNEPLKVFLMEVVMTMRMNSSKEDDQRVFARCAST